MFRKSKLFAAVLAAASSQTHARAWPSDSNYAGKSVADYYVAYF
ncbi:hypothetical protein N9399_03785 [Porticoccaceae bacterium]|nr:hypothetical protein [Porticoccaceae bacterium]